MIGRRILKKKWQSIILFELHVLNKINPISRVEKILTRTLFFTAVWRHSGKLDKCVVGSSSTYRHMRLQTLFISYEVVKTEAI